MCLDISVPINIQRNKDVSRLSSSRGRSKVEVSRSEIDFHRRQTAANFGIYQFVWKWSQVYSDNNNLGEPNMIKEKVINNL